MEQRTDILEIFRGETVADITKAFADSNLEPGEYRDTKLKGFILRVSETGVKSYLLRARVKGGSKVSHTIGKHGAPWSATSARKEAEQILSLMKLGADPRDEARQRKAEKAAASQKVLIEESRTNLTLAAAFEKWYAADGKTKESTKALYKQLIGKHLKAWLELPLANITALMVADRYPELAETSVSSANATFRALRMLYNWYLIRQEDMPAEEQFLTTNPVKVLHRRQMWRDLKPRTEYITAKQLPLWFEAVTLIDNPIYSDYFQFVIVTGLRLREASMLKWDDVDFDMRVFTARDTKNGTDHTLPMTAFTSALLKRRLAARVSDYVFPAKTATGYFKDVRYWCAIIEQESHVHFTCHMLRKTLSNFAMDANISDGQRKLILNHANRADVTDHHYSKKEADRMRDSMLQVESLILKTAQRV